MPGHPGCGLFAWVSIPRRLVILRFPRRAPDRCGRRPEVPTSYHGQTGKQAMSCERTNRIAFASSWVENLANLGPKAPPPMSTQAGFYLCVDGPLRGELHHRGPRFGFDGTSIGEERGVYVLEERQYHWHAVPNSRSIVLEQSSHRTALSIRPRTLGA